MRKYILCFDNRKNLSYKFEEQHLLIISLVTTLYHCVCVIIKVKCIRK